MIALGGRGHPSLAVKLLLLFGYRLDERVLGELFAHDRLELEGGSPPAGLDGLLEERDHHEPLPLLWDQSHRHRSPQRWTGPRGAGTAARPPCEIPHLLSPYFTSQEKDPQVPRVTQERTTPRRLATRRGSDAGQPARSTGFGRLDRWRAAL